MTASAPATAPVGVTHPENPYVGPRPFRSGELFYGREREATGLVNALVSGRIALLHSPSGAGKTSLIQAAVVPAMAQRDFQICAQRKPRLSAARVSAPPPEGFENENRYVASVVACVAGHLVSDPLELRGWTIGKALDELASAEKHAQQLLILDQFEEVLTLDPTDLDGQRTFFRQLGAALDNERRWALIAMREDFMGGLDRFLRYIPGQLRSTFRLDLLDTPGAMQAVQRPAKERGVEFANDAAERLITDLQMLRANGNSPRRGTYVEPVLLQVVCDSLWRMLSGHPDAFDTISATHLDEFGSLDTALRRYYSYAVAKASGRDEEKELRIRDWIQDDLLTRQGLRRQTRTQPDVADPEEVLRLLQERYLIRDDPRPNATWWELSHDRLSDPIVEDNRIWRELHLQGWQRAAYAWHRERHPDRYLLRGEAYRVARTSSRKALTVTKVEREFLERSAQAVAKESKLSRTQARVNLVLIVLFASLVANVVLVGLFVWALLSK